MRNLKFVILWVVIFISVIFLWILIFNCIMKIFVIFLISKGADVNAKNRYGQTALKIAIINHNFKLADYLRSVRAKE